MPSNNCETVGNVLTVEFCKIITGDDTSKKRLRFPSFWSDVIVFRIDSSERRYADSLFGGVRFFGRNDAE